MTPRDHYHWAFGGTVPAHLPFTWRPCPACLGTRGNYEAVKRPRGSIAGWRFTPCTYCLGIGEHPNGGDDT